MTECANYFKQKVDQVPDLISLVLWTYNQERYIRDALQGAFSQTYSPLEIIISDDCSTDRTFEIIRNEVSKYEGPHTIFINRNERNLGIGRHVNSIVARTRGALIVCAAGDDISLPHRVAKVVEVWKSHGRNIMSIYSSLMLIDEHGTDIGIIEYRDGLLFDDLRKRVRGKVAVEGASHAFSPELFKLFGPIPDTAVNEDVILQMRAVLTYGVATVALPLVKYRKHSASVNCFSNDTSATFAEQQKAMCERSLVCLSQFAVDVEKRKSFSLGSLADDLSVLEDAKIEIFRQQCFASLRESVYAGKCNLSTLLWTSLRFLGKGTSIKSLASYFLWLVSPPLFMLMRRKRRQRRWNPFDRSDRRSIWQ